MATLTAAAGGFRIIDPNFANYIEYSPASYGSTEIRLTGYDFDPIQIRLKGLLISTSDLFYPLDPNPDPDGTRFEFHVTSVDYYDIWQKGNTDPKDDVVTFHGTLSGLDFTILLDQYENATGPLIGNYNSVRAYLGSLSFTVNGSGGNDAVGLYSGRNYDPIWTFGENDDVFNGNGGDDSFFANAGSDILYGNDGNDWLRGGAGADLIYGGNGNDLLGGAWDGYYDNQNGGDIAASGADLADRIYGGNGNDLLDGGDGNDSLYGENGDDTVLGGSGNDYLVGGNNNDQLNGDGGNDLLYGQAGNDSMDGGPGNDTMAGGAGADYFWGGEGIDTVSYLGAAAGIAMTSNIFAYGTGGEALGDNADRVEVFGGSNFADTLTGWDNPDTFYGFAGDDLLTGGLANDRLDGGTGSDTASYADAAGAVTVTLLTGYASGAAGVDRLLNLENVTGSAFHDTLTGSAAANTLDGGLGNDVLTGGGAGDRLIGGAGSDTAAYRTAAAGVSLSLATGGTGGEALGDSFEGIERVNGSEHADQLGGSSSSDLLYGYGGADVLNGLAGSDWLSGGAGADHYVLSTGTDTAAEFTPGAGGDVLDLSALLPGVVESGAVLDDYLQLSAAGSDTRLRVDVQGAGGFAAPEATTLLKNVALFDAGLTQAQMLDNLLASGNLDVG